MNPLLTYSVLCFGSLFSIVDPFAAVPIFLVLVGSQPKPVQHRIALRASLTCFAVLTAFAAGGSLIFTFFGITIPAFKVAGGILLFGVALDMMRAKPSPVRSTHEERTEAESKDDVGVIPMGIPLLSGPGAIAATMVLAGKAHGFEQRFAVHASIVAVSLLTLLVLRSSTFMARVLGRTGLNVIGRIMGLILAAVAVQFILDGVREALPLLLHDLHVGSA
jgi:multiple antibiotic resistance protein